MFETSFLISASEKSLSCVALSIILFQSVSWFVCSASDFLSLTRLSLTCFLYSSTVLQSVFSLTRASFTSGITSFSIMLIETASSHFLPAIEESSQSSGKVNSIVTVSPTFAPISFSSTSTFSSTFKLPSPRCISRLLSE